ncbi:hypothetical protein HDU67_007281 [Dinochytrium kinnereticum]|nr:hypothetical protein HDU67_007281 [Dinochytrium kinnereticum]
MAHRTDVLKNKGTPDNYEYIRSWVRDDFAKSSHIDDPINVNQNGDIEKVKLSYAAEEIEVNEMAEKAIFSILKAGKFQEFRQCISALAFRDQFAKSEVDLYHVASCLQMDLKDIGAIEHASVQGIGNSNSLLSSDSRVLMFGHGKLFPYWEGIDPTIFFWGHIRSLSSVALATATPSAGFNLCRICIEASQMQSLFIPKSVPRYLVVDSEEISDIISIQSLLAKDSTLRFRQPVANYPSANAAFALHLTPKVIVPLSVENLFSEFTGFERAIPFGNRIVYKTALLEESSQLSPGQAGPTAAGVFTRHFPNELLWNFGSFESDDEGLAIEKIQICHPAAIHQTFNILRKCLLFNSIAKSLLYSDVGPKSPKVKAFVSCSYSCWDPPSSISLTVQTFFPNRQIAVKITVSNELVVSVTTDVEDVDHQQLSRVLQATHDVGYLLRNLLGQIKK